MVVANQGNGGSPPKFKEANRSFDKGPASETVMSLSQALLAPLDAILKAQVHAARSFLNLLLQIGYPHQPAVPESGEGGTGGAGGTTALQPRRGSGGAAEDGVPYQMDFYHDLPGGNRQRISIPTLALVPLNPLGVSDADFSFDFYVRQVARHQQIQAAEQQTTRAETLATQNNPEGPLGRDTRPWYLVETPLSLQGTFAPSRVPGDENTARVDEARFHVEVKVGSLPLPAALEKLMTSLGQVALVEQIRGPNG